jgi:hypothetical protein
MRGRRILEIHSARRQNIVNAAAIVTLAIGERLLLNWQKYSERTGRRTRKYGYDLIVVKQPLHHSSRAESRSRVWLKCLVLSQDFSNG